MANNPRNGYTYRVPGTAPADDGTTATVRDFTSLSLRRMGMRALLVASQNTSFLSVSQL